MQYREYLLQKIEEFRAAYMEALGVANANNGAMLALQQAIAEYDKSVASNEGEADKASPSKGAESGQDE